MPADTTPAADPERDNPHVAAERRGHLRRLTLLARANVRDGSDPANPDNGYHAMQAVAASARAAGAHGWEIAEAINFDAP